MKIWTRLLVRYFSAGVGLVYLGLLIGTDTISGSLSSDTVIFLFTLSILIFALVFMIDFVPSTVELFANSVFSRFVEKVFFAIGTAGVCLLFSFGSAYTFLYLYLRFSVILVFMTLVVSIYIQGFSYFQE